MWLRDSGISPRHIAAGWNSVAGIRARNFLGSTSADQRAGYYRTAIATRKYAANPGSAHVIGDQCTDHPPSYVEHRMAEAEDMYRALMTPEVDPEDLSDLWTMCYAALLWEERQQKRKRTTHSEVTAE